jgi:serpin B
MFLLNAIYFKGMWQTKFDKDKTKNLPFYAEDGSIINIPTMLKSDAVRYSENNLFSAVQLPYGDGNYNMYLFLPQPNQSVMDIVNELNENNWKDWMDSFGDPVNVDIQIPRLKYEYEIKLNDVLSEMGMGIAFGSEADFKGINGAGELYIDYVKHKTYIEVNEEGTEAAAVTVVVINKLSAGPDQNIQFHVNRPFFYIITEKDTGAILFIGTVKTPGKS